MGARGNTLNVSVSVSHKLLLLDVIAIMTSFLINRCGSSSLIVKTHFYSLTKIDTFLFASSSIYSTYVVIIWDQKLYLKHE